MTSPEEVPRPLDGAKLRVGDLLGEDSAVLRQDQNVRVASHDLHRSADLGYAVAEEVEPV